MPVLRQNDVGTSIILTLKEDGSIVNIGSASLKRIEIRKPSGDVVVRTASFVTDGTDGKLACTIASGDLDETGTYRAAMVLTLGAWTGRSSSLTFDVEAAP